MRKTKLISINFLNLICLSLIISVFGINNVNAKTYDLSKKTTNADVSTRELAMLASLVYEDVPNDYAYTKSSGNGCLDKNGNLKNKECFYTFNSNNKYTLKGFKGQDVYQYIEGMSDRKLNSIVSKATVAFSEPGEQYYFLNFAHTKEMEERGWTIFDYDTQDTIAITKKEIQNLFPNAVNLKGVFDAVTFRRGNNFVIAFRGTDYPDLLEWIQDVAYIVDGEHAEAAMAYYYAQKVYDEILKETNNSPDTKIYVTGHSLGAYLAQVGGAAIIDKEAGITYNKVDNNPKKYQDYASMSQDYNKTQSHLEQVAYFNGMGVGGLLMSSKLARQVQNSLLYLSTHDKNGNLVNSNNKVNYSDNVSSSGRLVLYSMDSDPVSSIGLHYGEIYKLEVGADAITNHREKHDSTLGSTLQGLAKGYNNIKEFVELLSKLGKKERNEYYIESTNALENLIYGDSSTQSKTFDAIPELVSNQIASDNPGVNIQNYSLGSILENLTNDVSDFDNRYGINNIFDHFNANHETDSFVCLMDSGTSDNGTKYTNGDIENIQIEVSSNSFTCNNGECSTNKKYNDQGFLFNHKTVTDNYKGDNIMLTALIDGACAKSYTWYYSTSENGQYIPLGTTTDNKIIVPSSLFNNTSGTKTYYFKVSATYGDTYTTLKSIYKAGKKYIEYTKTASYSGNPTLNDGINDTLVEKLSTTSNATKVSLTVDTTPPTCKFKNSTENVKLSCKLFGLICSNKTVYPELVCTDDVSGINQSTLKFETKKYETGLISSLKITNKNKSTNINRGFTRGIGVTVTRKPTSKTPYIKVTGEVYDNAGNKATINTQVNFKITK